MQRTRRPLAFSVSSALLAGSLALTACSDTTSNPAPSQENNSVANNSAANNSPGNNSPGNNSPGNNSPGNNVANNANNSVANNSPGNNANNNPVNNANNDPVGTDYPSIERENGWVEYLPGKDTSCSRGTPYAFFVREGDPNKVLVDFIGGGACWNDLTCSIAGSIFSEDVEGIRRMSNYNEGIYSTDNPDNPFLGWTHVIIPYCTGDIHWGNSDQTYTQGEESFEIRHRGAVNTRAVLAWLYDNYAAPSDIFVSGCSAGAYGSILWSADVMNRYPEARVTQLGDSGAGIITDDFFSDSFPRWNAFEAFPTYISDLDLNTVDYTTLALPDLYAGVGNFYSNRTIAQFNTILDENQVFYFQAMGGGSAEVWSERMLASIEDTHAQAPNFRSFIAPGEMHCILPYDELYTVTSDGVRLVDWIQGLVDQEPVEDVTCEECGE